MIKIRVISVVIGVFAIMIFAGCSDRPASYESPTVEVMSTLANVRVVAADMETAERAAKAAIDKLHYVDKLMSDYNPQAQLYKVNETAFENPIKIDPDLMYVLTESVKYSELTGGAFDVTIGPVVDMWNKAGEFGKAPTAEEIAAAKSKVGYKNLVIDTENSTVAFKIKGMRIDLGGIAKGYSIDLAVEAMIAAGAIGGMVDVGGDIRCFGKPAKKEYWRIGLQDPKSEDILLVLKLKDAAVATSGDYQRFVMVDGERQGHIMNPRAGKSTKELTSVTVVASTAIAADALATSVTVMGPDAGLALIDSIDGPHTIMIPNTEQLEFIHTRGVIKYIDLDYIPEGYTSASKTTE